MKTESYKTYTAKRIRFWDEEARKKYKFEVLRDYYHSSLINIYKRNIPENQRILEIGCGQGDLLAALDPSQGLGIDFSREMIRQAAQRHDDLSFFCVDAYDLEIGAKYDYIIFSDVLNDMWDVQEIFENIRPLCESHTRIIINSYSQVWEIPLKIAARLSFARSRFNQNWLTADDIMDMLYLANFEKIRSWEELILPIPVPVLKTLCNRFLVKIWPFKYLALTTFIIARPAPEPATSVPSVSIIVPARNEEGNIAGILDRIPIMGQGTELIFVEGHSTDNTFSAIEKEISGNPLHSCKLYKQPGKGKGDAVRTGFAHASGDVLMILDADLTVPPEGLSRFYEILYSGKAEFANGVRLVYPMEEQAMRFLNMIGNKFFSLAFSWLLGQPIKDTLCGTKVLWKKDYEKIIKIRKDLGDFDPFGDFELLFGASRLGLKIVDVPIRYHERKYGDTNIKRWSHGLLLLKMTYIAALRIKFFKQAL